MLERDLMVCFPDIDAVLQGDMVETLWVGQTYTFVGTLIAA